MSSDRASALHAVEESVAEYDTRHDEAIELRDAADKTVCDAVRVGLTFREIAEAAGRSVSWVQAVVARTEPELITRRTAS